MTSYLCRGGKNVEADEAFFAWTSRDLPRMLRARSVATNPVDRHFLLMGIVGITYSKRKNPKDRSTFLDVARLHLKEFAEMAPVLRADMGGVLPRVPTFGQLATVLVEDGRFDEAVTVCETALAFGLHDGTKADFPGRLARIRKSAAKSGAVGV